MSETLSVQDSISAESLCPLQAVPESAVFVESVTAVEIVEQPSALPLEPAVAAQEVTPLMPVECTYELPSPVGLEPAVMVEESTPSTPAEDTLDPASPVASEQAVAVEEVSSLIPAEGITELPNPWASEPAVVVEESAPSTRVNDFVGQVCTVPMEQVVAVEEFTPLMAAEGIAEPASPVTSELAILIEEMAPSFAAEELVQLANESGFGRSAVEEIVSTAPVDETSQAVSASAPSQAIQAEAFAPQIPPGEVTVGTSEMPLEQAVAVEEITPSFRVGDIDLQVSLSSILGCPAVEEVPEALPGGQSEEEPSQTTFLGFHGLREQPFGVSPDPAYLYLGRDHQEALTALLRGVQNDRGFMALIAEPGMGKTTLLNKLMEELRDSARTVFLFQTQCGSQDFFRYLLSELGVENAGMDPVAMHNKLNDILFQEMLQGRRFVLIVDEAQNLHDSVLETIRLLSDFEANHAKLLQIVLAGQPPLAEKLMHPGLSQLRQRIAVLASLEPLNEAETARYIEHRLNVASESGAACFTPDAITAIAKRTHGIPRNINNLCFNALMLGYSQERRMIDSGVVQEAAAQSDLESLARRFRRTEPTPGPAPAVAAENPQQFSPHALPSLADQGQPDRGSPVETEPTARATVRMNGKLTQVIGTGHWGIEREFRVEVSLKREPSSSIPVGDRYYCASFYAGEEEAKRFRTGQPLRITIEQD